MIVPQFDEGLPEGESWQEVSLFGPEELAMLRALDQKFIDSWPGNTQIPPVAQAPAARPGGAST